ncbi:MAG: hypothetical protein JWM12_483 [Ilumatobacteraceae bacterium]|nr:hypothetical protein [Ilumatobacteraceae bacterium]
MAVVRVGCPWSESLGAARVVASGEPHAATRARSCDSDSDSRRRLRHRGRGSRSAGGVPVRENAVGDVVAVTGVVAVVRVGWSESDGRGRSRNVVVRVGTSLSESLGAARVAASGEPHAATRARSCDSDSRRRLRHRGRGSRSAGGVLVRENAVGDVVTVTGVLAVVRVGWSESDGRGRSRNVVVGVARRGPSRCVGRTTRSDSRPLVRLGLGLGLGLGIGLGLGLSTSTARPRGSDSRLRLRLRRRGRGRRVSRWRSCPGRCRG